MHSTTVSIQMCFFFHGATMPRVRSHTISRRPSFFHTDMQTQLEVYNAAQRLLRTEPRTIRSVQTNIPSMQLDANLICKCKRTDITCSTKKMSSDVVIACFLFVAIRNESSESSAQTLVFFFIMIFHLLPNGQGGEVLAAFCDEESSSPFNRSAQDMQATLGCNLKDLDANFVDCSFG